MKTILSYTMAVMMCLSLSLSAQTSKKSNIDGTYAINLTQSGTKQTTGTPWTTDEITFKSGMLRSKTMHENEKFDDATCDINMEASSSAPKKMTFKAEKKNDKGDKVKWKGTVTGNHIEGTVEWTNKQGSRSYSFTGTSK